MASPPEVRLQRRRFFGRLVAFAAGMALPKPVAKALAAPMAVGPYIGEIMVISFGFPPKGWAFCDGQVLPINQNQALFSLLGTTYGGDGRTTFALPDLRGRVPIHQGQGSGLTARARGERSGETSHTLALSEIPSHTHVARGSSLIATSVKPAGGVPARNAAQQPQWGAGADVLLNVGAIAAAGSGQAHANLQPYLALNYVIALQGTFPPQ
jgi:microcystin-dependent protein